MLGILSAVAMLVGFLLPVLGVYLDKRDHAKRRAQQAAAEAHGAAPVRPVQEKA